MIYFIFWVLLILTVVIAIPVVHHLDQKRRREALPEQPQTPEFDDAPVDAGFGDAEVVDPLASDPAADDFASFENEFK